MENKLVTFNLNYIKNFFSKGHERSIRAKKNIVISFISKGISILVSFIIVPLTLSYVGKVEYGIWMTLSSIIHWFAFFDIGLGNGLRNKLAEALAKKDKETAKIYISSAFALISAIAFLMLTGFYIAAHYISWNKVLNTNIISNEELFKIVLMVFIFFCVGFIFKLISSILESIQRYALKDILSVVAQLVGLLGIFILVKTTEGSLFNLCLVYGGKSAVVMLFAAIILFARSLKHLRPNIMFINFRKAFPLINLGLRFFLNQILYLIVTQSSLILVAQFFGPEDVTVFNLAVRYMTISSMAYVMILTPFLSAFTEAYTKNEHNWIRSTIKRINMIWGISTFLTVILAFVYKLFFNFWVGDAIQVPVVLIITLAISGIINSWGSTYSLFLNGIGKIHIQFILLGIQAIIFIPLSYLFYKLKFGLSSIVVAQILMYCFNAYFMTIQYKKIINQTATGIWMK
ncbi:lipopolysaccharide biosynthesis protein [Bacteroidota bacterium]